MKAIICGALLALMITTAAAAEDMESANYLLPYCKLTEAKALSRNAAYHLGRCYGIIETVTTYDTSEDHVICPPCRCHVRAMLLSGMARHIPTKRIAH